MNRMLLNRVGNHQRDLHRRLPEARQTRVKGMRAALTSCRKLIALIEAGEVEEAVALWRLHLRNAIATWTSGDEGERVVNSLGA